ncbi:MAG: DUF3189 family protein [Chloroflexota bacterium]|jgi:hypothetical protein
MKFIYHCWGGSHSSVICAAIHLGLLPRDRVPSASELRALPHFDSQTTRDHGRIFCLGQDAQGNDVCFLGRRSNGPVVDRILPGMAAVFGFRQDEVVTLNTMPYVNLLMVVGGTLSRGLGLVWPGRPIVTFGVRMAYPRLCHAVEKMKAKAARLAAGAAGATAHAPREPRQPAQLPFLVFYHCYGSAHSSVVASAIHLGLLPADRRPTPDAIAAIPHYDRTTTDMVGTPFRIGADDEGHEIYIVGMIRGMRVLRRAIRCLVRLLGLPQDRLLFVNCLPLVNLRMRIGGFLSRQLGLISLGRPLTISGVLASYQCFADAVARVRAQLRRADGR